MVLEPYVWCACPACAAPTLTSGGCLDCDEAFASAQVVRPEPAVDDLDAWDAWAVLGDPGVCGTPLRR